jgi:hypothetical protein
VQGADKNEGSFVGENKARTTAELCPLFFYADSDVSEESKDSGVI